MQRWWECPPIVGNVLSGMHEIATDDALFPPILPLVLTTIVPWSEEDLVLVYNSRDEGESGGNRHHPG